MALADLSQNPTQRDFIFCPDKYCGYFGGIRNGKSYGASIRGILLSLLIPENRGLIGRKTYPELRDTTWKDFLDLCRKMNGGNLEPGQLVKSYNRSEEKLVFQNGSEVIARYLDNYESILSLNLGWWFIDQAEEIPEETYLTLEGRLSYWTPDRIREWQTRTGFKFAPKHYGFITGNPAPGWVLERYKKNPTGLYRLFEAPSEANSANLPPDQLEQLRKSYPEDWVKRFLDGSWDILAGQIYKDFNTSVHVIPRISIPAHWPRYIALDHGYTNPTAVLCMAVNEHGDVFVYLEYYASLKVVSEHAQNIKAMVATEPIDRTNGDILIWADPSTQGKSGIEGKSVQQEYALHGIHLRPANNQVMAGILKVSEYMKPVAFRKHPITGQSPAPAVYITENCVNLIEELKGYEWERNPPGRDASDPERPKKVRDHAADAFRYGIMAITEHAVKPRPADTADPYDRYLMNIFEGVSDEPMEVL